MNQVHFDRNKNPITSGDHIRIIEIPEGLPDGLPEEDQVAIYAQVGKVLVVQGFEMDGSAELEFVDDAGHIHTIWLNPNYLEKSKDQR